MLAVLVGYLGDFELAEESVAEAFAVAARRWPAEGMPDSPAAWLVTTARHRAIDRLRRDRVLAAKLRLLAATTPEVAEDRRWTRARFPMSGLSSSSPAAIPRPARSRRRWR